MTDQTQNLDSCLCNQNESFCLLIDIKSFSVADVMSIWQLNSLMHFTDWTQRLQLLVYCLFSGNFLKPSQ